MSSYTCECFPEIVSSRVSIRLFKPDSVPDDVLLEIIKSGINAPSAGNGKQWFFIIVKDAEKRKAIHKLLLNAHRLYAEKVLRDPMPREKVDKWMKRIIQGMYLAPVYIAAYIDLRDRLYKDEFYDLEKMWAIQSISAAIENMLLTAQALGLGGVWLGVPLLMRKEFDKILQPPNNCELQAIIALGYPAEKPKKRPRKPIESVIKIL